MTIGTRFNNILNSFFFIKRNTNYRTILSKTPKLLLPKNKKYLTYKKTLHNKTYLNT